MIHKLADVHTSKIGVGTKVWQFSIILEQAIIGNFCNINCHTFIENDVFLGDYVTIKSGVYIWDGIEIEDYVFIGPNVTFTNDKYPRSKQYPEEFQKTQIKHHASVGAAATILGGLCIGAYAVIGANSLITKDVPARALVIGQPARIVGWVNEDGSPMTKISSTQYRDNQNQIWQLDFNQIQKI